MSAALLAVAVTGLSACGKQIGEEGKMLNYLEEKYKEKFTIVESYGGQLGKEYTMLKVSGKYSDNVLVRVMYENGSAIYQDNYTGYIQRQEIQNEIQPLAKKAFGTCKVFYRVPGLVFPVQIQANATASEILENAAAMTRIFIYPQECSHDSLKKMETFRRLLKQKGYCISGVVSFPATKDWYEEISEENFGGESYLGYEAYEEVSFQIDEYGEFRHLKWIKNSEEKGINTNG